MKVRANIKYAGHVHGVGFRFTARSVAAHYDMTGYVKNIPDGTVEVVSEGERKTIESFFADLGSRMSYYIREADIEWSSASGEFKAFDVCF